MLSYNIYRNNERLCVAGVGDFGVLTACVTWVGHTPEKLARWASAGISEQQPVELTLHVGGLKSDDGVPALRVNWIDANLRVGDEIKIQVVDVAQVDAPTTEHYDDPVKTLESKRNYVRQLARELGWDVRES
jgi:hypothetical protein